MDAASSCEVDDPIGRSLADVAPKSNLLSAAAVKASNSGVNTASAASTPAPAVESITRKDVVGALKSLMVAAGLPMSMDQEKLAESVMQLKASMAEERFASFPFAVATLHFFYECQGIETHS